MRKRGLLLMISFMSLSCVACTGTKEGSQESVTTMQESTTKQTETTGKQQNSTTQSNKYLTPVPEGYLDVIEEAGTITTVEYASTQPDGKTITKKASVYLPYGYDETKKYDIIYCLHGGEGNAQAYLGTANNPAKVKKLLDNMIYNGDIKPIIAVAPTYYTSVSDGSDMGVCISRIEHFTQHELVNELIPAVESKYSTYAETTDCEGIKASREHRGYTGFSMGSLSTWYTFLNASDYFYYYMPMSGDCWVNGVSNAVGAASTLEKYCTDKGYDEDDFFIYAVTGSSDIAYAAMDAQINAMKTNSPSFKFITEESETGNIRYRVQPAATHDYNYLPLYFYNAFPSFFGK